jgi:hypothetical protein
MSKLLTRQEFRESVFERDNHKCVVCGISDVKLDAHHILERQLWSDGGYYIDNGATLCDKEGTGCHMKAEITILSVETIRESAGIKESIIPEDLYSDHEYDKWGNVVLANGTRTKGPLFHESTVQKVLRQHADFDTLFSDYVKYPRTYHVSWSPGVTDDDRIQKDMSYFENKQVVVTRKMDGENFTGYGNYCHARSIDGRHHYTRDWAKNFWMQRSYELPTGWRVCGENLYAEHSIPYEDLESYLLGFSIWNEKNQCLSWDETKEWFGLLEIDYVPVLYEGLYDENKIKGLYDPKKDYHEHEGYVIRLAESFDYKDLRKSTVKYVRENHVQSRKHWFYGTNDHKINSLML